MKQTKDSKTTPQLSEATVSGSVSKVDKINKEIEEHEKELERLFILAQNVSGGTVDVCPQCKTKNYHWSINNKWCCAFC
jgi:hypothetical protein